MEAVIKEMRNDGIEVWTLNRPGKRNALDREMLAALSARVGEVSDRTRAVVLTGAGETFCAGLDLDVLRALMVDNADEFVSVLIAALEGLFLCPAPTIAAIRGAALAGGFDLAAMCDLRVSTPNAKFGQLEARLGIPGLTEPHWRIMGLARAKESVFTAGLYDGAEAWRIGFVNRLAEDPLSEALALAEKIAANGARAVRAMKASAQSAAGPSGEILAAFRRQMEVFRAFLKDPDVMRRISEYAAGRRG